MKSKNVQSCARRGAVKFIYSEKATKVLEIFTLLFSHALPVKSKVKISQNFVAFSEYMNFTTKAVHIVTNFTNMLKKIVVSILGEGSSIFMHQYFYKISVRFFY